jgi:CO/xanthine dehydrogenase Mo-binding subunit
VTRYRKSSRYCRRGGSDDRPAQGKGVGELGISGAAAAVANAIYNATGVRVRDYPVTLDKSLALDGVPPARSDRGP